MVITIDLMIAEGAVTFQTDILDDLGGSLDTSNVGEATAAALAGLDLIWITKKFSDEPDLAEQIAAARDAAEAINKGIKDALISIYDSAKDAFDLAVTAITGQVDPEILFFEAQQLGRDVAEQTEAVAEASTFVALFTGQ